MHYFFQSLGIDFNLDLSNREGLLFLYENILSAIISSVNQSCENITQNLQRSFEIMELT